MASWLIVLVATSNAGLGKEVDVKLLIEPAGSIRCIYGEEVELHQLGRVSIQRGSHVEPDGDGRWTADLSPVNGPTLGPFDSRSEALAAEHSWLLANWLTPSV